ncbi:cold-shock protein [Aestuariivirga sp.]|uniref:cold-shock protein n=1 Tax=Aestuariivirga sp. TaxID=2650926 RepID=UPI0037842CDD
MTYNQQRQPWHFQQSSGNPPDDGGRDIIVHISAVERAGLRSLAESQAVSFEVTTDRKSGKDSAEQLRAL